MPEAMVIAVAMVVDDHLSLGLAEIVFVPLLLKSQARRESVQLVCFCVCQTRSRLAESVCDVPNITLPTTHGHLNRQVDYHRMLQASRYARG